MSVLLWLINALFLLLIFLSMPFLVIVTVRERFNGFIGFALCAVLSSVLMATPGVVIWLGIDYHFEQKVAPLDRDGDGFWSDDEEATWTKEEKKHLEQYKRYIGDNGRNVFALVLFSIFSTCFSFLVVSGWWLIAYFKQSRTGRSCT